jgi:GNAT superfamily N-acetyltransferase
VVRAFEPSDVGAAGRLLAARHIAHRRTEPLLSPRFEDPATAATEVETALTAGATGTVAEVGGEVTGFLLGQPKPNPVWGANVWVEAAGHAVAEAETIRDLYAEAATSWVERRLNAHYVLVPAQDAALVDAWFRLGFGQQHVHGIREVGGPAAPPPGVTVRVARRSDIPVLAGLDLELTRHQGLSPTFSGITLPTVAETVADWEESFDDEGFRNLVAEHEGRVVGGAIGCPVDASSGHLGLARPDHAGFMGFAAVLPEARGLGVGRALGEAVLAWTAGAGFTCAVTDWRATNLLSSRAWPRLGYRPTFLRLHRLLAP